MQKYYIGIMTGTSMDGIDIAVAEFSDNNEKYDINIHSHSTYDFSDLLHNKLNSLTESISFEELSNLNIALTNEVAANIKKHLSHYNLETEHIIAIGYHGQTLWHQPVATDYLSEKITSTLQIGSGSNLAVKTGIAVVNDFRTSDMAVDGQGAPLIPVFDYHFLTEKKDVVVLNIGGIANITYLKANCKESEIIAFDTGPGNALLDLICRKYFSLDYDRNGNLARRGKLNETMLNRLMNDEYITKKPPKSTGKEYFNMEFLENNGAWEIGKNDLLATLTYFTAKSIAVNIQKYCNSNVAKVKVSGGGKHNDYLIELLQYYMPDSLIEGIVLDDKLITDSREALLMAFLAYLRINKKPGNMPSVTGATSKKILGQVSLP